MKQRTHHGFIVFTDGRPLSYYTDILKGVYDQSTVRSLTVDTKLSTIRTIQTLIGSDFPPQTALKDWIMLQLESDSLTSSQIGLLSDTVKYIKTGYRRIPLAMYEALLGDGGDTIKGTARLTATDKLVESLRSEEALSDVCTGIQTTGVYDDLLYLWCNQPNGFIDLLGFFILITHDQP